MVRPMLLVAGHSESGQPSANLHRDLGQVAAKLAVAPTPRRQFAVAEGEAGTVEEHSWAEVSFC